MERHRRTVVATFFVDVNFEAGGIVSLPDEVVQHVRVRRLEAGAQLRLTNGRGAVADGTLDQLTKGAAVAIANVVTTPPPPRLRLFLPVADRERMLWLAEKTAEIGLSVWQPVFFRRSASVSPRGEGDKFAQKVRARMIGALEQSGGAWLPEICAEVALADALVRADELPASRYLLERGGSQLLLESPAPADVLLGPEGGIEADERALIVERHGWRPVSLAGTTLRFETAGVLAVGILRTPRGV